MTSPRRGPRTRAASTTAGTGTTPPPDWVGYTFATARTFTKVVFQEGMHFWDGGFFAGSPTVHVRQGGMWVAVTNLAVTPAYAGTTA